VERTPLLIAERQHARDAQVVITEVVARLPYGGLPFITADEKFRPAQHPARRGRQ
jgi:hypothetical protein